MKSRILIIDDEEIERVSLQAQLNSEGYQTDVCSDGLGALKELEARLDGSAEYDVILCDIRMPQLDGFGFLEKVRKQYPLIPVLLTTAYATVEDAVKAMRQGAFDYLTKPFSNDELTVKLEHALNYRRNLKENIRLKQAIQTRYQFCNLVGKSRPMQEVFDKIQTVAPSNSTVLIQGETGTGKELVASAIHYNSPRRDKLMVKVSCAVLNKEVLERELFGHEVGSFTGAIKMKRGRFELAHLGSIFLDEVDDIPYELQVKLLRVIEEKKFERVGGEEQIASDVRIIAASKFNLRELVSEGKFRDDLFYRLGVITINLPPLRDRKEDIPYLAAHFLGKYTACKNMPAPITSGFDKNIPPEILKYLMDYDWPGNVRELENVIEQMVTINKTGKLEIGDLPESLVMPTLLNFKKQESFNLTKMVDKVEREIIEWALTKTGGNQTKASEILGIPRTTLREKMNRIKNP